MKAVKIFMLMLLVCVLASCGVFRRTNRIRDVEKVKTSESIKTKSDTSFMRSDRTVTVETSTTRTKKENPGAKIESDTKFDSSNWIKPGGVVVLDSGLYTVRQYLDTTSGIMKTFLDVKPDSSSIETFLQRTTYNDIAESGSSSNTRDENRQEAIEQKKTVVEKKPVNAFWWWAAIVGAVLVVVGGIFLYFKNWRPGKKA